MGLSDLHANNLAWMILAISLCGGLVLGWFAAIATSFLADAFIRPNSIKQSNFILHSAFGGCLLGLLIMLLISIMLISCFGQENCNSASEDVISHVILATLVVPSLGAIAGALLYGLFVKMRSRQN